jgi:hypothetical protein
MKTKIIITSILLLVGVSIGVMKYWHLFPYIVIHGQVLDESNNTINNATVHAFFGVNDEEYTKTGDNGKFISIPGYRQYWGYLVKRKAWGPTFYNVKVKLQHGPEEPPIKEDL